MKSMSNLQLYLAVGLPMLAVITNEAPPQTDKMYFLGRAV